MAVSSAGDWDDAHGIFANPMLINAPTDMHLQASSPAINAGLDLGALSGTEDIDGNARVYGAAIDIGANEYGSSVPVFKHNLVSATTCPTVKRINSSATLWALSFNLPHSTDISYSMIDMSGKTLFQSKKITGAAGHQTFQIDVGSFAKKVVLLRVESGSLITSFRLVN